MKSVVLALILTCLFFPVFGEAKVVRKKSAGSPVGLKAKIATQTSQKTYAAPKSVTSPKIKKPTKAIKVAQLEESYASGASPVIKISTPVAVKKKTTETAPWSIGFSSSYGNKVFITDETEDTPAYTQSLGGSYRISGFNLSANTSFVHLPIAEDNQPNSEFNDFSLAVSRPFQWESMGLRISPSLAGILPLSYQAREVRSQRFAVRTGLNMGKEFSAPGQITAGIGLGFAASYINSKYEDTVDGAMNPEYVLSPTLSLNLAYRQVVGIFGSIGSNSVIDQTGRTSQSLSNSEGIFVNINKYNKLSAGHAYRANVLKPDGQTEEYKIASELYSQFFVSWELSI